MSYTAAIDSLKALLSANPMSAEHVTVTLHYSPDPRIDTLSELDGFVDGAFLIVNESPGNPFPYVQGLNPSEYYSKMRLEVCTLLHTDVMTEDKIAESRARAVQETVALANFPDFVLFNVGEPSRTRAGQDRRIIWTMRFSMRYSES